jgi:hypothetical protein
MTVVRDIVRNPYILMQLKDRPLLQQHVDTYAVTHQEVVIEPPRWRETLREGVLALRPVTIRESSALLQDMIGLEEEATRKTELEAADTALVALGAAVLPIVAEPQVTPIITQLTAIAPRYDEGDPQRTAIEEIILKLRHDFVCEDLQYLNLDEARE